MHTTTAAVNNSCVFTNMDTASLSFFVILGEFGTIYKPITRPGPRFSYFNGAETIVGPWQRVLFQRDISVIAEHFN